MKVKVDSYCSIRNERTYVEKVFFSMRTRKVGSFFYMVLEISKTLHIVEKLKIESLSKRLFAHENV